MRGVDSSALVQGIVAAGGVVAVRELAGLVLSRRKTSAEAEAAAARATSSRADAAKVLSQAAASIVTRLEQEIAELRAENAAEVRSLRERLHRRDVLARNHVPWDRQVADALRRLGQPVSDPPPLMPNEEEDS